MATQITSLVPNPAQETIQVGNLTIRFLLTGNDSGGSVAAFEMVVPGHNALPAPAHSHDGYEESVYSVDGTLTWTVDGKELEAGPGQLLCIPRGAVHRFENRGIQDVRALCVITPGVLGPEYFRAQGEVLRAAAGGPPDHAKLMENMRRHGLTPA